MNSSPISYKQKKSQREMGWDGRLQIKERKIRPKFSLEECDLFILIINSSKQTVERIINRMSILHFVSNSINEKNSKRRHSLIGRTTLKIIVSSFILFEYSCYLIFVLCLLFHCQTSRQQFSARRRVQLSCSQAVNAVIEGLKLCFLGKWQGHVNKCLQYRPHSVNKLKNDLVTNDFPPPAKWELQGYRRREIRHLQPHKKLDP